MNSRYLVSLEGRLRRATTVEATCVVQAEMAAYFARQGNCAKAGELLVQARKTAGSTPKGELLAWINFAEGLVEQFSGRPSIALTKWERAKALAGAVDHAEVTALASVWLGFSAYLKEDLDRLEKELMAAIGSLTADNASAVARMTLTLGLSFHYCGDILRASENYRRSRHSASSLGDEVAISALIHDMAAMTIAFKRSSELSPNREGEMQSALLTSAETADSFEELVGVSAVPSLGSHLLAHSDILESKWADAIRHIDCSIDGADRDGFGRVQPGLLADRAYCLARLGHYEAAQRDALDSVRASQQHNLHGDDRAIMLSRLSETYNLLGRGDEAQIYSSMAEEAWSRVTEFQSHLAQVAGRINALLEERGVL